GETSRKSWSAASGTVEHPSGNCLSGSIFLLGLWIGDGGGLAANLPGKGARIHHAANGLGGNATGGWRADRSSWGWGAIRLVEETRSYSRLGAEGDSRLCNRYLCSFSGAGNRGSFANLGGLGVRGLPTAHDPGAGGILEHPGR